MKVWIATAGMYDDEEIVGVFTNERAALISLIGHRLTAEGWSVQEHDVLDAPEPASAPQGCPCVDEPVDIASPDHLAALRDRLLND